jgi:hypothetical protein
MTPDELKSFLDLTAAIERHQQALDAAVKSKQQLARTLYERYGRNAVYRIAHGEQLLDLMIARTKADTYYFAPRVRYPKESRLAKAEKKRLDRAARLQSFPTQASVPRPPLTQAEIDAAIQRGRSDLDPSTPERAALAPNDDSKVRLPIVGDVDQPSTPEPRLLAIQEPSGVLFGDPEGGE